MKKDKLLQKAKNLRRKGNSFREISEKLSISKSTASLWVRSVKMDKAGKKRFDKLIADSKDKCREYVRIKKERILNEILNNCTALTENKKFTADEYKLLLAMLYWGEGAKTGRVVIFINSDPEMIITFLSLFRGAFKINENKLRAILHLHSYHNKHDQIKYWSKLTGIKKDRIIIYQKENSGTRRKLGYRGCISVRYGDSRIFDEIFIIIKRFVKLINAGVG